MSTLTTQSSLYGDLEYVALAYSNTLAMSFQSIFDYTIIKMICPKFNYKIIIVVVNKYKGNILFVFIP